jgi:hypothetical protein
MKILSILIAVLVLSQANASINKMAPLKFKGQKALTLEGKQVRGADMVSILKKQKTKFGAKVKRADWEGVYTFKVTAEGESETGLIKVPVLSSAAFPGSALKNFENFLLQMPIGVVVDENSWATSMLPWVVTEGKDHEGVDIYVGLEDYGFFFYRLALNNDRTGTIYLVETLSGEPKEVKVGTLELTTFETKASLNLEVSTYDYQLQGEESKKLTAKSGECGTSFKGEMGFVKFPSSVAVSPAGYAWQNTATDGGKCSIYFVGSPVGPRAGNLKVENPAYLGCMSDGSGEEQQIACGFGLASELQFQGVPAETNLIMRVYLTRVYQYEVAASVNLIKR